MGMWKLTDRIRRLAARSTPSTTAPGRSKSPLLLSARFSAQSDQSVADKNGHDPSFFAKAFESILRHVLRDKMTPLPCDFSS